MSDWYDEDEDSYEDGDIACPACGHAPTHSRHCQTCDEFNEVVVCCDDICVGSGHCIHGDGMAACPDCDGTGIERWCPKCSANYWHAKRRRASA